ncbi:MAG TPA: sigma 54-interacting transcriptional regulator [Candidatus Sulfotelmatobacter sp.]|nr:sigma 54-interacting transcriptional regulator [Candidatus Sulfotelmatobacter sp.]
MCPGPPTFETDLQRYAALLEITNLAEMADTVSRYREPAFLFRELTPLLGNIVAFDFINFALYDSIDEVMRLFVWDGRSWPNKPDRMSIQDSAVGWAWQNQAPAHVSDTEGETRFGSELRWLHENRVRSYCVFPLTARQQRLGALAFGRRMPQAFTPQDMQLLHRVSEMVALCVDGTLNRSALAEARDRAHLLLELETALFSTLDLKQLFPVTAQSLRKLVPYDSASMAYFDEGAGMLRQYRLDAPPSDHFDSGVWITAQDSLVARAFRQQQIQFFNRESLTREPQGGIAAFRDRAASSLYLVPLATAKGHVGVLSLESLQAEPLSQDRLSMLGQMAVLVALALENALVHRNLRLQRERMQALLSISTVLAAHWDLGEVFPKTSSYLRRVLRQEYASVAFYDETGSRLVRQFIDFPMGRGSLKDTGFTVDVSRSHAGKALATRSAMIFSRAEIEALDSEITEKLIEEGIKSLCCVPLSLPRGTLGTLTVASTRENAFRPDDTALLRQVASQIAVAVENARATRQIEALKNRLEEEKRYLEGEISTAMNFEEIVGESPALQKVLEKVVTVAKSDANVLILGETGTGKELIARAIHRMSRRKDASFIKLNCAAIPTGLLESELFGHEKGAFTGAISQKIGRMELADGGTLFLDEIGEILVELQPKLLRVLQDREFERLGGTRTIKVNLRLIAATNRDLAQSVARHEFRSDLFYRLNVFPVQVPPLRERAEDIPMLVRYFVRKYARRMERHIESIPTETMNALQQWHWPGNVRELENFIERSVILTEGTVLRAPLPELQASSGNAPPDHSLENAEREHILKALREANGVLSGPHGAGRRLGLKRTTLQSKMQRLGITREDYAKPKAS